MYIIETDRLGLRHWQDSDIPRFIEMNKDPRVMEYFPKLLSDEETLNMVTKINRTLQENDFGLWAVEVEDSKEFIGFLGLSIPSFEADFTPCVEIGWRFAHAYWGKGYAQEAGKACLDYGFNVLELQEIVSFTAAINKRSINVMEKIGLEYVKSFNHPRIENGNSLQEHVLYSITAPKFIAHKL